MAINTTPHIHSVIICANVFIRKDGKYLVLRRSPLKKHAPDYIHPIGGKVEDNENPYEAVIREAKEEAGVNITNVKIEAIVLEIKPKANDDNNWVIYNFSADYDGGEITETEEGELVLLTAQEIQKEKLYPSIKELIGLILDPNDGTVFASFTYNDDDTKIVKKQISICAKG